MLYEVENAKEGKLGNNRYDLNLLLKDAMDLVNSTSSGSSFHILGASCAKLRPNCFVDL